MDELRQNLSNNFQRIADWLEANDFIAYTKAGKTECMLHGTPQRIKNKELEINYRQQTISNTSTFKYLSIY